MFLLGHGQSVTDWKTGDKQTKYAANNKSPIQGAVFSKPSRTISLSYLRTVTYLFCLPVLKSTAL